MTTRAHLEKQYRDWSKSYHTLPPEHRGHIDKIYGAVKQ